MKLTEIAEALEMQSNDIKYFYDKKEKKLCFIMEGYDDDEMNPPHQKIRRKNARSNSR